MTQVWKQCDKCTTLPPSCVDYLLTVSYLHVNLHNLSDYHRHEQSKRNQRSESTAQGVHLKTNNNHHHNHNHNRSLVYVYFITFTSSVKPYRTLQADSLNCRPSLRASLFINHLNFFYEWNFSIDDYRLCFVLYCFLLFSMYESQCRLQTTY